MKPERNMEQRKCPDMMNNGVGESERFNKSQTPEAKRKMVRKLGANWGPFFVTTHPANSQLIKDCHRLMV